MKSEHQQIIINRKTSRKEFHEKWTLGEDKKIKLKKKNHKNKKLILEEDGKGWVKETQTYSF